MNKVILIGGDHHNTLGVAESFGQKGIKPYAILYTPYKRCYVPHSKFVESGWRFFSEKELVDCLKNNFNNTDEKAVIIATHDVAAEILDRHYDELKDICLIPTVKPAGSLGKMMSKEYMSNLAQDVGLNVPKTWILKDTSIPAGVEYPVITKAISSLEGSKSNIKICRNEEDLLLFIKKQQECSTIQIQQYIDKEFEFQLLGVSINHGENVIIPGRTHIDRPKGIDNTFFLYFDKYELSMQPLVDKAIEFVKRAKYSGPFSIEFLREKGTGDSYFTEMNFRNDGNAYVVTAAGMNIPYIYYLSQTGGDYQKEIRQSTIKKTYLVPEAYYFSRLLSGEVSLKEWWRNMKKADCCTTYFKNDKKPFFWFFTVAAWKRFIPSQI